MLSTDKIGLLLDEDGDLDTDALSAGELSVGLVAVEQGIRARIQLCKGEWFLDLDEGVPWFEGENVPSSEALIGGRFDAARTRDLMAEEISDTPGVTSIVSLAVEFNPSTRVMTVTFRARSIFGDAEGTVEV